MAFVFQLKAKKHLSQSVFASQGFQASAGGFVWGFPVSFIPKIIRALETKIRFALNKSWHYSSHSKLSKN